jgi:hypothetical protein
MGKFIEKAQYFLHVLQIILFKDFVFLMKIHPVSILMNFKLPIQTFISLASISFFVLSFAIKFG